MSIEGMPVNSPKKTHWIHFKIAFLPKMYTAIWKTKMNSIIFNHKIQEYFSNC